METNHRGFGRAVKALVSGTSSKERRFNSCSPHRSCHFASFFFLPKRHPFFFLFLRRQQEQPSVKRKTFDAHPMAAEGYTFSTCRPPSKHCNTAPAGPATHHNREAHVQSLLSRVLLQQLPPLGLCFRGVADGVHRNPRSQGVHTKPGRLQEPGNLQIGAHRLLGQQTIFIFLIKLPQPTLP